MFAYCSVGKLHGETGGVPRHGGVHICISGEGCSHSFAVCGVWLGVVSGGSPVGIVFNGMVGGFKLLLIRAGDVPKLVGREEKRKTTGLKDFLDFDSSLLCEQPMRSEGGSREAESRIVTDLD